MTRAEEDAAIAEFIAHHGVTRCPPAMATPTRVDVPPEVAEFHRERRERLEALWKKRARQFWGHGK